MYAYSANGGYEQPEEEEYYEEDDAQEQRYEVLTPTRSYVEPFKHINLEGRLIWPGRSYFRALDADWWRLKEENQKLKECLARSGNAYMLSDANKWMEAYTELKMENAGLKAKLEEERALHRIEIMELEHRADYYEERYKKLVEINSSNNSSRDSKNGRFKSSDGLGREEKEDKALEMYERNVPYAEIGRKLDISAETAKIYIRAAIHRRGVRSALKDFETEKKRMRAMG